MFYITVGTFAVVVIVAGIVWNVLDQRNDYKQDEGK